MTERKPWDFGDLDGYIRQGEPEQAERADNWQVAIGLQAVDGLAPSAYLLDTAKEHVEGRISISEAQRRISSYYEQRVGREEVEGAEEADIVSSRIAEILGERAFTFSPVQLQTIHRRLFDQVLPRAGKYRSYNITKKEWVLKGETVYYASFDSIADTLRYDFAQEADFDYRGLSATEVASHMARFIAGIWQIHPFGEGNTRTTAVFAIKYLRSMGFDVNNDPFKQHSWYFCNALVRANYEEVTRGITPTTVYLERFFENLLCGAHHELRNRYLHLDWPQDGADQETTQEMPRTTQETTQEEIHVAQETMRDTRGRMLELLKARPEMTARQLLEALGITFDGARYHLAKLRKAGVIHHEGPTKGGRWVIDVQVWRAGRAGRSSAGTYAGLPAC